MMTESANPPPQPPQLDANARQFTPATLSMTCAAASVMAAAESGAPVTFHNVASANASDYGAVYEDLLLSGPLEIRRGLLEAAGAAHFAELVGIPTTHATSTAANKAATAAAAATTTTDDNDEGRQSLSGGGGGIKMARASAMAIASGTASLCPLDRTGLSKTLWLHITTSVSKGGGWRCQIWGGTRPLDDPCVRLTRDHPSVLERLNQCESLFNCVCVCLCGACLSMVCVCVCVYKSLFLSPPLLHY